ncbi:MAG: hypothetical protein AAGN46_17675 [Acidobacteriota bacterium]
MPLSPSSAVRPAAVAALALLCAACSSRLPPADGASTLGPPHDRRAAVEAQLSRIEVADAESSDVGVARLRIAPTDAPVDLSGVAARAEALLRRDARAEALELLLDAAGAVAVEPRGLEPRAWWLLGRQLDRAGSLDAGLEVFRVLVSTWPTPQHRAVIARALVRRGRHGEAAAAWRAVFEATGDGALRDEAQRGLVASRLRAGLAVDPSWIDRLPQPLRTLAETGEPPRARVETLDALEAARRFDLGLEVRIDAGGAGEAAEPSVAAAGDTILVSWNDARDPDDSDRWRLGVGQSVDGGATWSDRLLREPQPPAQDGDPMTAADPRTGDLWLGGIQFGGGGQVFVARRPAGGPLGPPVIIASGSGFDKGWMEAGSPPGDPSATRLYVTYSFPNSLQRSTDRGATWSAAVALDPNGLGFLPRARADGELMIGYFELEGFGVGDEMRLQRSIDGGQSVGAPRVAATRMDVWDLQDGSRAAGDFRLPTIPSWAVDRHDGTLYLAYFDTTNLVDGQANLDVYFSRSVDDGVSWSTPRVIHGDGAPPGDQFFPWIEVDAAGRLHAVYFDSRHTIQSDNVENGLFDVYYATSGDRGDSWTEVRLTTDSFGTGGLDWPVRAQFLGDYLGLTATDDGVLVVYPRSSGADLDLFARRIALNLLFADGFERGDPTAWSSSTP